MKKITIKKEKAVMALVIGIACFSLMLVMFMQFKVVNQTNITEIESMTESELRLELSNWRTKYKELSERYDEVSSKIDEYKTERESDSQTAKLLEEELEQLNEILGKTDVIGEGIIIVLTDKAGEQLSEDAEVKRITYQDMLMIVQQLFGAGAEAISINGQRITALSEIVDIGDSFIAVNTKRIESPYVINAIGNQTYLESSVLGKGGYVDELKELGHEATITKEKDVKIEKYDKEISTKYID